MKPLKKVAENIVDILCPHKTGLAKDFDIDTIEHSLRYLLLDVLKIVKNINETSLSGADRTQRIIELEEKYGIPKTHIL